MRNATLSTKRMPPIFAMASKGVPQRTVYSIIVGSMKSVMVVSVIGI
jgi:hypothetical protein